MTWYSAGFFNQLNFDYFNDANEKATLILRAYSDRKDQEWELRLGGIPLSEQGKEVVLQFHTPDVNSGSTFYTDSNGLEMQKRVLDYRPTWDFIGFLNIT
jgi:hypothetical protein